MAVATTFDFDDGIDVYRRSIDTMNYQDNHGGEGILFHMVWERPDGGFSVTDVFDTAEHADAFMQEVIMPQAEGWGMTNEPRMTRVELANHLYPKA